MSLKTIVKVGGITSLSDARYCAGMGVDMLGFCFSKTSENYIEIYKIKEIIHWISGVEIYAEFDQESKEEIESILSIYDFDGILTSNLEVAIFWKSNGKKVIFEIKIKSNDGIILIDKQITEYSAFNFVQITCDAENLVTNVETKLLFWSQQFNILKSFNLNTKNLTQQIEQGLFKGIALTGSREEKPGFKDYDEIADILELLEMD